MPKSKGRPKDRQRKTPKPLGYGMARCHCGGKATRFGVCIRHMTAEQHDQVDRAVFEFSKRKGFQP